ncbi:Chitinase domain-containing protein 1 [Euphorbia peplus]|nr:Chitinase domain-containing protein 1 [Euphorbia peplus]
MARRRDSRVVPTSDLRQSRGKTTSQVHQYSESAAADRKLFAIFVFFFVVIPAVSILVYRINSSPDASSADLHAQQEASLKTNLKYQEILNENSVLSKNESHRRYAFSTLAYVTPWNSKGYEMAKKFANKFTHISPVWYDLKSEGTGLILEGRHNADKGWMSELRKKGNSLVLPRVVLEAFPKELLRKKKLKDKTIELIVSECKEMGYDGIVLESWSRWAAYGVLHDPGLRNKALQFIKQLGHALHSVSSASNSEQQLQLVFVIGPPHSQELQVHDFGPEDLQVLDDAVDGFSLMTYDFSGPQNPGPNAPLNWIRFTLQMLLRTGGKSVPRVGQKIFLGLNFYGNDFLLPAGSGGGPIVGREYLSLLDKHKPELQWEKNSGEHFFLYVDDDAKRHAVFYPSVTSITLRLDEALSWGTGISIWEMGQGLDYFFDLL